MGPDPLNEHHYTIGGKDVYTSQFGATITVSSDSIEIIQLLKNAFKHAIDQEVLWKGFKLTIDLGSTLDSDRPVMSEQQFPNIMQWVADAFPTAEAAKEELSILGSDTMMIAREKTVEHLGFIKEALREMGRALTPSQTIACHNLCAKWWLEYKNTDEDSLLDYGKVVAHYLLEHDRALSPEKLSNFEDTLIRVFEKADAEKHRMQFAKREIEPYAADARDYVQSLGAILSEVEMEGMRTTLAERFLARKTNAGSKQSTLEFADYANGICDYLTSRRKGLSESEVEALGTRFQTISSQRRHGT